MTNSPWSPKVLAGVASVALALVLIALGLGPTGARATTGTVTAVRTGPAPAARRIALELPLRVDAAGLARFAAAVSDPSSPSFHRYASLPALERRFGAPAAERSRVTRYLRRAGATHVSVAATGLFVSAEMRVGRAQALFGTRLATFHANATGEDPAARFLSPVTATHLPASLRGSVTGVVGLDTRPLALAHVAHASPAQAAAIGAERSPRATAPQTTSAYTSRTGTPAGCPAAVAKPGFTPNQYLTAYGFAPLQATGLLGEGERVALIEIDGFKTSDVRAFAACYGLAVPKIDAFGVGIKDALPAGGESTLDLELLDAAAPRLSGIDVYESRPLAADVLKSLTDPLSNKGHRPDVISASLGSCEQSTRAAIGQAGIDTVEQSLQLASATGISVLASSGDDGSTACVTKQGQPLDTLSVNFPASSPWVTGVGGTNVKLSAANTIADPMTDQVVWNDEPALLGAGGGGISTTFDRPSWQDGFVTASHREVPDVSMLADPLPGYEVYCSAMPACVKSTGSSPWQNFGGTSAGTPLLAGGFALVDQALKSRGQQTLGLADPLLYKLDRSASGQAVFADVVSGSNDVSGSLFSRPLGCCTASPGYDQASGLGSVDIQGLAGAAEALQPKRAVVGLTLPAQSRPIAAEHFSATVSCTTECLMGAYVRLEIGGSSRPLTLFSQIYELTQRRSRTIDIGLNAQQRTLLRDALSRHESVTATIYGAIVDASGAVERRTAGRTLAVRG